MSNQIHPPHDRGCSCSRGKNCDRAGKHPRTLNGAEDATRDVSTVAARFKRRPKAKIGIANDPALSVMQLVLDKFFEGGKHVLLAPDGCFHRYDGRCWQEVPEAWIAGRVLEVLENGSVGRGAGFPALIKHVTALLHAKVARTDDPLNIMGQPPAIINCKNGELWFTPDGEWELRSHNAESYLSGCMNVVYDPSAQCPDYDDAIR